MTKIRAMIFNKRGQSVLEYIILTSLIGIFCLIGIKSFGERVKKRINYMSEQVTSHIKIN